MQRKILVATTNPGKVRELGQLLGLAVDLVGLSEFQAMPTVVEDAATFAGNARKKASEYARAAGLWTISDDSGLVIDALDGQPGIRSARFSGAVDADRSLIDRQNIQMVLDLMRDVPDDLRTARFQCCLCLAAPDRILIETEGAVEGIITREPLGDGGFGYDPIFWVPPFSKTFAQLTPEEKNAVSHRGRAIERLRPLLQHCLTQVP